MFKKLIDLKNFVTEILKTKGIRRNVLLIALTGTIVSFVVTVVTLPTGLIFVEKMVTESGYKWGENTADLAEKFYQEQTKYYLREKVSIRSNLIGKDLENIADDVHIIAETVEEILTHQNQYIPRYLPNPRNEQVPMGVAYFLFNKRTLNSITPDAMEEMYRVANIEDAIVATTHKEYWDSITDVTVVSAKDYVISMDYNPNKQFITMSTEYMDNLDYQTLSTWYRAVRENGKIFFTKPRLGLDDRLTIHCGAPYYDSDGNFAGGVSIATEINSLYKELIKMHNDDKADYNIIINNEGQIILSSEKEGIFSVTDLDLRLSKNEKLAETVKRMIAMENDIVTINIGGKDYYVAFAPIEVTNWSFVSIVEQEKADASSLEAKETIIGQIGAFKESIRHIFLIMLMVSLLLVIVMFTIILTRGVNESNRFFKPIQRLVEGVNEIATGNFDRKLEVTTEDEIGTLANAVNSMADNLKKYMADLTKATKDKERIATELNVATNIQSSALPHDFDLGNDAFEIYATMNPAKEVGGDFYDFYMLDENHLVVTIADVSGKGVGAALFMMQGKTILKNLTMMMKDPDDLAAVMTLANNQICQNNDEMMFITVFHAILDLKTGRMIYVNGGHNPPLHYIDAEEKFHYLEVEQNCVLGLMEGEDYVQQEFTMQHGDIFYMYTDGVTEAMNKTNEQYGEERLENCLNEINHQCNLVTLLEGVRDSLALHVKDADQSDDITMVAVRFNKE